MTFIRDLPKFFIAGLLALSLAACETPGFLSNRQENAGLNYLKIDYCHEEEALSVSIADKVDSVTSEQVAEVIESLPALWSPCEIELVDGKERSDVAFALVTPDGTGFEYSSAEERAFEGQRIRGEVAKAQMKVMGEIIPELTEALVDALNPAPDLDINDGEGE